MFKDYLIKRWDNTDQHDLHREALGLLGHQGTEID